MGRAPCCDKASVKKGPWSPEEDAKLKEFIDKHGTGGNWIALPHKAGLNRCGKSCRLRWLNYLRPNIKHGEFSQEEERIICAIFASIGSRWSIIASHLPGRTDNDIKNYWNTKLKKKFLGIVSTHPSRKQQQQQQEQLHQQQQQQQQYYYYLSPFLSSSSAVQLGHPELELLTGFGAPLPKFCDQNGPSFPSAHCMHSSSMINFGSDASCSSSGGSCAPIDCGTAAQFDYGCDGKVFEGEQFATSIDNYSIYPGNLDNSNRLLLGGGAAGHHLEIPLHYTYGEEEIKNLLSSSSGCNNACNSSLF